MLTPMRKGHQENKFTEAKPQTCKSILCELLFAYPTGLTLTTGGISFSRHISRKPQGE